MTSLANTGEVLYLVNRPANVPSHTGAGERTGRSIDLVAPHVERVCVRGDTHFSLPAHFDEWSEKADFIFGYRACPVLEAAISVLDEESWQPLKRRPRWTSRSGQTRDKRPNEREAARIGIADMESGYFRSFDEHDPLRRHLSALAGDTADSSDGCC